MPYIEQSLRARTQQWGASNVGELTYELTDTVLDYLRKRAGKANGQQVAPSFALYAEVIGALEATKLELYARSVRPHEDAAAKLNGDLPYPEAVPVPRLDSAPRHSMRAGLHHGEAE